MNTAVEYISTTGGRRMPVHDWTRVSPGTFHDFHGRWITHLSESLNAGLLQRLQRAAHVFLLAQLE